MLYSKSNVLIIVCILFGLLLFWSCNPDIKINTTQKNVNNNTKNAFTDDAVLQKIVSLQNSGDTQELLKYIDNPYPEYRKACALSFASIHDTTVVKALSKLLKDTDFEVRIATAYSYGQIGSSSAEIILIEAYKKEENNQVKKEILEAIGKCGSTNGLLFLSSMNISPKDDILLEGQAWGLSRYSIREITSEQSTKKASEILSNKNSSKKIKLIISHYFALSPKVIFTDYYDLFVNEIKLDNNINTKINLTKAIGKIGSDYSLNFLHQLIESNYDDRIKKTAIKLCSIYSYNKSSKLMFKLINNNSSKQLTIPASEFFIIKGIKKDANKYFQVAKNVNDWETRTNMLTAALKYSENKTSISLSIISGYEVSDDVFEKAKLLYVLSGDPTQYKFVQNETFYTNSKIISTSGIKALYKMRLNPDFNYFYKVIKNQTGDDLYLEFSIIFKEAIQSKDIAMMFFASKILQNKDLDFRELYNNTHFIKQAMNDCVMPRDLRAYIELRKAHNFIFGEDYNPKTYSLRSVNWKILTSLSPKQKAIINTTKGNIIIELNVNEAPIAVSNFIRSIQEGYYTNTYFFRVIPNLAIQTGCKRGDGWGNNNFVTRSELSPNYFIEGSLAMASIGNGLESVQWFITQFPAAQLDGEYTNFGTVIKGMDVVHQIEVSDKINSIKLM